MKYSQTWIYTFEYDEEDIEGDIYPFIVKLFAEKYNIDEKTADKIIDGERLEEQIYYDNEDEILEVAKDYYEPYTYTPDYDQEWKDRNIG